MIISKSSLLKKGYFKYFFKESCKSFSALLKLLTFLNKKETISVDEGRKFKSTRFEPNICDKNKAKELCEICPTGAIYMDSSSKKVEYDPKKCVQCSECSN